MKKILIIEDDKLVASIYQRKFQQAGFDAEIVHDGQEGFYRLHEAGFSSHLAAILLDLMLPQMGGLDILKKVRAQKQFEAVPVFVLTNAFLDDVSRDAAAAGATRVFDKASTTPKQLVEEVKSHLVHKHPPTESSSPKEGAPVQATETDDSNLLGRVSSLIEVSRKTLQSLSKAQENSVRQTFLLELSRVTHALTSQAAADGLREVAHLSSALEALLVDLENNVSQVNSSSLRTIATAIDFLGRLGEFRQLFDERFAPAVFVVDDDSLSRRAAVQALRRAGLRGFAISEPAMALNLATENKADLFVVDVEMPVMNGFELCRLIRQTVENAKTPVIFVTVMSDFESRAKSALSGGNDLIAKPFLPMELGLKSLIHIYQSKFQSR